MTAILLDDAVPVLRGIDLDRVTDVAEPITGRRLLETFVKGRFRIRQQTLMLFRNGADGISPGRIAVEAIDNGADIDGDDVTVVEVPRSGNSVDDLLIDRGADISCEPVMAEKVGCRAVLGDGLAHDVVELLRGDAGNDRGLDPGVADSHHMSGTFHLFDIGGALEGNAHD